MTQATAKTTILPVMRGALDAPQPAAPATPHATPAPAPRAVHAVPEAVSQDVPAYDVIELFFFAYRDFVGDPDRILDEYGFGRAHHRVLHFVARNPGLTIAELLEILRITKQSLNRVLKELIEKAFVEVRPGVVDRRQRLLYVTDTGRDLAAGLARLQTKRVQRALDEVAPERREAVLAFLLGMIDPSERAAVARLVAGERAGDTAGDIPGETR